MRRLQIVFKEAIKDYSYLLERNYPQKSILKLVGDRYQLRSTERSILFRGIITRKSCEERKQKTIDVINQDSKLFVDGYNVFRTIGSYLLGKLVFISMDGFLRDASEMHRSVLPQKVSEKTLGLFIDFLLFYKPELVTVYLDSPISKSGELASMINRKMNESKIKGNALTVHSPDHHLKQVTKGINCTADSSIIDASQVKVFDFAMAILRLNFQPDIIDLDSFI